MTITASDVKKLRDMTGAGMMECKKALIQAEGDIAKAEKILKEMGLAAVAKRQDRATDCGRTFVKVAGDKAVILELSTETDFVAINAQFVELGENLCDVILAKGYTEIVPELTEMVSALMATIKENMNLKRFQVVEVAANELVAEYVHGAGSVSVLVKLSSDKPEVLKEKDVTDLAHDLALHVAAFKPQFLQTSDIPKAYEEEQLSIFSAQAAKLDKPAKVIEGIIKGKLAKLYAEITFLNQAFIKDDSKKVSEVLASVGKAHGANLAVEGFVLYQAGVNA